MIERALRAMGDPEAFFAWMAGEPEDRRRAFGVVLIAGLVSAATYLVVIYVADTPEAEPMRELIRSAKLSATSVAIMSLVLVPLVAVLTWGVTWIPIRIGAGAGPRLWEVAAWSQIPAIVLAVLQLALMFSFPVGRDLAVSLSLIGALWGAWFVYAGVKSLSSGHALRAALLYLFYFIIGPVLGLLMQSSIPKPGPSPGMLG